MHVPFNQFVMAIIIIIIIFTPEAAQETATPSKGRVSEECVMQLSFPLCHVRVIPKGFSCVCTKP